MPLRIEYKASVERDLRRVGRRDAGRILRRIEDALRSESHRATALSGEFAGLWRLRVGNYRVIYARTKKGSLVLRVGHRRDACRKGPPGAAQESSDPVRTAR